MWEIGWFFHFQYCKNCGTVYINIVINTYIFYSAFTHLIMEGIAVVTNRELSQSHPIFRLLAPHFLFLLAINRYISICHESLDYYDSHHITHAVWWFSLVPVNFTGILGVNDYESLKLGSQKVRNNSLNFLLTSTNHSRYLQSSSCKTGSARRLGWHVHDCRRCWIDEHHQDEVSINSILNSIMKLFGWCSVLNFFPFQLSSIIIPKPVGQN